ncbi:hypothetical protein OPV22_031010 [Ensete ventricosum]|uniref:Uncharacterized protein n=1 Tax=Ensete ventricosum TaxID=4639 RepID=A0AAV8PV98_ENSVE|nr:hypothetical protein OPV22_031010 [Ensete ventricosum]
MRSNNPTFQDRVEQILSLVFSKWNQFVSRSLTYLHRELMKGQRKKETKMYGKTKLTSLNPISFEGRID